MNRHRCRHSFTMTMTRSQNKADSHRFLSINSQALLYLSKFAVILAIILYFQGNSNFITINHHYYYSSVPAELEPSYCSVVDPSQDYIIMMVLFVQEMFRYIQEHISRTSMTIHVIPSIQHLILRQLLTSNSSEDVGCCCCAIKVIFDVAIVNIHRWYLSICHVLICGYTSIQVRNGGFHIVPSETEL